MKAGRRRQESRGTESPRDQETERQTWSPEGKETGRTEGRDRKREGAGKEGGHGLGAQGRAGLGDGKAVQAEGRKPKKPGFLPQDPAQSRWRQPQQITDQAGFQVRTRATKSSCGAHRWRTSVPECPRCWARAEA